MVETTLSRLSGEQVRYGDDTWELTGEIAIGRNGEVIDADAVETGRGRNARFRFELERKPGSINPGNLGSFEIDLKRGDDGPMLIVRHNMETDRYRLDGLTYA